MFLNVVRKDLIMKYLLVLIAVIVAGCGVQTTTPYNINSEVETVSLYAHLDTGSLENGYRLNVFFDCGIENVEMIEPEQLSYKFRSGLSCMINGDDLEKDTLDVVLRLNDQILTIKAPIAEMRLKSDSVKMLYNSINL